MVRLLVQVLVCFQQAKFNNNMYKCTCKPPNTTIADFANTIDPDELAHTEPSHLDLQCLHSILIFNKNSNDIESFLKF